MKSETRSFKYEMVKDHQSGSTCKADSNQAPVVEDHSNFEQCLDTLEKEQSQHKEATATKHHKALNQTMSMLS